MPFNLIFPALPRPKTPTCAHDERKLNEIDLLLSCCRRVLLLPLYLLGGWTVDVSLVRQKSDPGHSTAMLICD